jgi:YHS domain-containing protein
MKMRLLHGAVGLLVIATMLVALPNCSKEEKAPKEPAAAEPVKEAAEAVEKVEVDTMAAIEAKLAAADAFDGTTDKIVSKCAGCALAMDGKSEHTLEVSGYKLYFCAEECKTHFEKDVNKAILALKIPKD